MVAWRQRFSPFCPGFCFFLLLVFSLALSQPAWAADEVPDVLKALQKNPALKGISLALTKNSDGTFTGTLGTAPVTAFKVGNAWNLAMLSPTIDFKKYAKSLSGTPLADMTFDATGLIVSEGALSFTPDKVGNTAVRDAFTNVFGTAQIEMKAGFNLFALVGKGTAGDWGRLKTYLGLGDAPLVMQGILGTDYLVKFASGKAEDGLGNPKDFDLAVQIPTLAPIFMPSPLKLHGGTLTFGIVTEKKAQTLSMSVESGAELTIANKTFLFASLMTLSKAKGDLPFDVTFTSTMVKENSWNAPSGANFGLKEITFFGEMARGLEIPTMYLGMSARAAIKDGPTVGVTGTLTLYGKEFDDFTLKITDPIKFGDLPGVKDLEGIKEFTFKDIALSLNGFSGTIIWSSKKNLETSFMLFAPKLKMAEATLLIKMGNIDIQKLIPKCKLSLVLPKAYLIISRPGIVGQTLETLAVNLGAFLSDLTQNPRFRINFQKGVTLAASLDPASVSPDLKKALSAAGISGPTVISGGISGLFSGAPSFSLTVQLPTFSFPEKLQNAKFFKPQGVGGLFYISLTSGFDLSFGMGFQFMFNLCGSDLTFEGRTGTELSVTGVSVNLLGRLNGTWENAFGLPGVHIQDLVVGYSLDADASIGVKCAGKVRLGDLSYDLKFGTKLVPEAVGFPKEVAIDFTATTVKPAPFGIYFQIAEILFKSVVNNPDVEAKILQAIADPKKKAKAQEAIGKFKKGTGVFFDLFSLRTMPLPEIRDFRIRLVTPGATDADLRVAGPGAGLKGILSLLGKDLAKVDSYLELTGLKVYGEVLVHNFGPLKIEEAKVDIAANLTELPHFYIRFKINLIGIKPSCLVSIDKDGISFSMTIDMNELFLATFEGKTDGKDITAVKDFDIHAQVKTDFSAWIHKRVLEKIQNWEYDDEFKEALEDLASAESDVRKLQNEVDKQRLIVLRDRQKVLMSAEKAAEKAKELDKKISDKKKEMKKLPKWRIFKKAKLAFEIAGLVIAREACELYAKAVEESLESIPIDADPRVWGVIVALKTALAGLHAAEEVVEAGNDVTDELKELGEKIAKGLAKLDFFVINNAEFLGSIRALAGKEKFTIKVDATVCDERVYLEMDFDWKDVKKSIKSIVTKCVTQLRSSFARNKSKKTKFYRAQTESFDGLDDAKPFAEVRNVLTPEFRSTMLARSFARREFHLVNRLGRLALVDSSGKALLGSSFLPHSTWKVTCTSDGYFTLTSTTTGKCLMVEGGKKTAGTPIVMGSTANLPEKEWRLEATGKAFLLRNRLSGKVLGIPIADQDAVFKAPFAGYPVELQDAVSISSLPIFGLLGRVDTKTIGAVKRSLFQAWDLIQTGDLRTGNLKHSTGFFLSGEKGVTGLVKAKNANTAWELFPVDNDPLSPYVFVRHGPTGQMIRGLPIDQKALIAASLMKDPLGTLKAWQPGLTFLNLNTPKDAIWRVVRIGDSSFALVNILTGNVLAVSSGILHQCVFPEDPKATQHLWSLVK